jgi:hypothetical protein
MAKAKKQFSGRKGWFIPRSPANPPARTIRSYDPSGHWLPGRYHNSHPTLSRLSNIRWQNRDRSGTETRRKTLPWVHPDGHQSLLQRAEISRHALTNT